MFISNYFYLNANQVIEKTESFQVVGKPIGNLVITDLLGNEFIMQATTTAHNESNGSQSLEGVIDYNDVNKEFIKDIERLWEIYDREDKGYKIIMLSKKGNGDKLTVNFKAIPLFFDYMDTRSMLDDNGVHLKHDGSLTARAAFNHIFKDTPFTYALVDSFLAADWENFGGGESKLTSFKRALDRYGAEFEIVGNTIYLKKQIGRDTSIQYRYKLNADNIVHETDASGQITAMVGYGDFGDMQANEEGETEDYRNARIKTEYVSPLASISDNKIRWGFYANGTIKNQKKLDEVVKEKVENSLQIGITADIVNLKEQGYDIDESQAGDRVFIIDPRIELDQEVRVKSQSITKDWKGRIIDAVVQFGSEGLGRRHQSNINTTVKNAEDLLTAFGEDNVIPLSFIDNRVREVTATINGNVNSVFKYMDNGVIGHNGDDPNYMTRLVGDALAFTDDGGNTWSTFISAKYGINANFITAGELRGINIYQESASGSVSIENGEVESYIGGKKAMKWGGWKQEYYNPDGTLIGSLEPTRLLNSENYGLSLTVTNDFLTIGHWIGGQRRPVFRTQDLEGRKSTYVLGPYDARGSNNDTELVLGANSNIGLAEDGKYSRYAQASMVFRNKPSDDNGNSATLYFGGISKYSGQEFNIRANTSSTSSKQVAVFRQDEIRLDTDRVYLGGSSARVQNFTSGIYLYASGDARSGLKLWNGGQVDIMSRGVSVHKFLSDGSKSGGSIEIDGKRLGMSPVDSPQTLIEYIEFNVEVSGTKKVSLDKKYIKAVSEYAAFSSNKNVTIKEKKEDHIVIEGEGLTDLRIVGKRVGYDTAFWNDMEEEIEEGA